MSASTDGAGACECECECHQQNPAAARITSATGTKIFTTFDAARAFISSTAAMISFFVLSAAAAALPDAGATFVALVEGMDTFDEQDASPAAAEADSTAAELGPEPMSRFSRVNSARISAALW